MNQALQEYRAKKREAKIEKYSFIAVVGILSITVIALQILWLMKIS